MAMALAACFSSARPALRPCAARSAARKPRLPRHHRWCMDQSLVSARLYIEHSEYPHELCSACSVPGVGVGRVRHAAPAGLLPGTPVLPLSPWYMLHVMLCVACCTSLVRCVPPSVSLHLLGVSSTHRCSCCRSCVAWQPPATLVHASTLRPARTAALAGCCGTQLAKLDGWKFSLIDPTFPSTGVDLTYLGGEECMRYSQRPEYPCYLEYPRVPLLP